MTYDKILKGSACRVPDRNHCHGDFISKNFVRNLADDCITGQITENTGIR